MSKPPPVKYVPIPTAKSGRPPQRGAPVSNEKRPPPNAIEKMYEEILEETLTPPEVRKRLVESQSIDQKWRFIQIHKHSGDKLTVWGEKEQGLLRTIDESMSPDIITVLNLKVLLSSANRDFMSAFITAGGAQTLARVILRTVNKKPYTAVVVAFLYEVLLCCKLVMNNAVGMKGIQEAPGALHSIALCLSFDYKPLALLVLEILSATCYSEASTKEVLESVQTVSRKNREPSFSSLNAALVSQDVEVKTAIMQFIISIILGADIDTHSRLRKDLNNIFFEHTCEQAMTQVTSELSSVEDQVVNSPLLNYQKALTRTPGSNSPKKVVNLEKLEGQELVAFKGIRQSAVRGHLPRSGPSLTSGPIDAINRAKAREDMTTEASKAGMVQVAALQPGCFGSTPVLEPRWCVLDGEHLSRHVGPEGSPMEVSFNVSDIKDIRRNVRDVTLLKLAEKNHVPVLEIITGTEFFSFACSSAEEVEAWRQAIQAARDQVVISKSSYYMHRTYLELKDALRVAERFKKLVEQYTLLTQEEKAFETTTYGFDLNNIHAVFTFLTHEATASGNFVKLLNILQELLLIPSNASGMWDAIIGGIRNLRRILNRQDHTPGSPNYNAALDTAFNDFSLVDMLARKQEEEGDGYKQMSKLALSHMTMKQESESLKDRVLELEKQKAELDRLLEEAGNVEKKELVLKEEELTRLRVIISQNATTKELDDNQIRILSDRAQQLDEKLQTLRGENETLSKKVISLEDKLKQQAANPQIVYVTSATAAAGGGVPVEGGLPGAQGAVSGAAAVLAEKFAKYEKMKKMLPEGAVRQKMAMDNLSPDEIESFFSGAYLTALAAAPPAAAAAAPPVDERYAKFEKMKKMLPEGAVRQKMAMEGFKDDEIEAFMAGKPPPGAAPAAAAAPPVDERYAKFEKMKKMLPEGAVRQKMAMEGFKDDEIEAFMTGKPPPGAAPAAPAMDPEKAEKLAKYEKMKKMLPEGAVRQKMAMDGFSPVEIDAFFGIAPPPGSAAAGSGPALPAGVVFPKLSPPQAIRFNKYEKLMKKGTSLEEIKKKMQEDEVSEDEQRDFLLLLQYQPTSTPAAAGGLAAKKKKEEEEAKDDPNKPKIKLKNLFWNKLNPNDLKGTVWTSLSEHKLSDKHRGLVELWFAAKAADAGNAQRRATLPGNVGNGVPGQAGGSAAPAAPKLVSVLDGKRTQNVLIIMGKIRKTPEDVMRLVWELDTSVMTLELTNMLLSIIPNAEEEKAVAEFNEETCNTLETASKLFYYLTRIPRLSQRLECHEVAFNWVNTAQEFTSQLKIYLSAIDEMKRSQVSLNYVLSIVLSVGNYLNGGTKFGSAQGVKLDTLNKLATLKATEASHGSLLNLVAVVVFEYNPKLMSFTDDWVAVWAAADLNYKQLLGDINNLESVFNRLQNELTVLKENKTPLGLYRKALEGKEVKANPLYKRLDGFLTNAKIKLQDVKNNVTKVEQGVEGLMASYGENCKDAEEDPVKRYFQLLVSFIRNLRKAHEDNARKRLAAEKAAKAAEAKAAKARAASLPPLVISSPRSKPVQDGAPADNIFGRFHSLQEEDSEDVLAQYRLKLSGRQTSTTHALAALRAEGESPVMGVV